MQPLQKIRETCKEIVTFLQPCFVHETHENRSREHLVSVTRVTRCTTQLTTLADMSITLQNAILTCYCSCTKQRNYLHFTNLFRASNRCTAVFFRLNVKTQYLYLQISKTQFKILMDNLILKYTDTFGETAKLSLNLGTLRGELDALARGRDHLAGRT